MAKYLIEGSCDGSLFSETIEANSADEAEALAIQRLCEAWGEDYGPDVELSDLGDCASVTEYTAEDYARDAAPAMLEALRELRGAADAYAEHGKQRHYTALQTALGRAGNAIAAATGQPIEEIEA